MEPRDEAESVLDYESSSDSERSRELLDLATPMSLDAYMNYYYGVEIMQDSELYFKLQKYEVFQSSDNQTNIIGLRNADREIFFAKYDWKPMFETEKRSHEILDRFNCQSLIKMVDAIPLGIGGLIITPLYFSYHHGELRRHLKSVMKQLMEAIKVGHDNGVAHRDIKPQNIVWHVPYPYREPRMEIFLTDFGIACFDFKEYENKTIERMPGTLRYFSPEKLLGIIPPDPRVCDIFAAGVVFLELIKRDGRHTFKNGTLDDIYRVMNGFDKEICPILLPNTADLLKKMLEIDYKKRITVHEALAHPFFADSLPYFSREQYAKAQNIPITNKIFEPSFIIENRL